MDLNTNLDSDGKLPNLSSTIEDLRLVANHYQGDCLALLELLRTLEQLHREICESLFLESLPSNRQALYNLLRDIETSGGWPYIQRIKLRSLLDVLSEAAADHTPDIEDLGRVDGE
ncbi:hypothetical protein [Laspinema palackyanum]|uniref:hypothetical protein n=1 Tax=Laspinema palackyanum TaxID=3231601 RepID=UPI00345D263A|nr:hypothetical protein [Laspinema sp. D2c]